eukprot:FR744356.1.p1 GENE.FR744356.1~~FR744356.1.p1  ORF type:complete len:146 (+),score=14.48 FR744356.1:60-440(+)
MGSDGKPSIDYQRVFYDQSIPMAIATVDGRFIDCNPHFEDESGYSKSELMQISLYSLAREDGASIFHSVAEMLKPSASSGLQQQQFVVKATLNTGKQRYMKLSTVHEECGQVAKYFSCALLASPND